MMYELDLLPVYNYFKAIDGEINLLSKDGSEVTKEQAETLLSEISDRFSEIVNDTSYRKAIHSRLQLIKMNIKYLSCLSALERLQRGNNEAMEAVLTSNGFVFDKEKPKESIQDIFEQLQSLQSLYSAKISEYVRDNEGSDKADMYCLVSDVEQGLTRLNGTDTKINVQTTSVIQLAHYIKRIKDDGKRVKNTNGTSR